MTPEDFASIKSQPREIANRVYEKLWDYGWETIAELGRNDRFFLLVWLLKRLDANRDWIYERCREVEDDPDDHLDLWAREHYKSTIITHAGIIQEILKNPEITIGIFSFNRPSAKKFLAAIKREFESNEELKIAYSDVLWKEPQKEAPLWSEDKGLIVKRKGNPKEATLEAYGLIEGLPSGPHFDLRDYDDVITEAEVTSPEMMEKALHMWRQSQNLGKEGGRRWHAGTRYHFNDPYRAMLDEKILKPRVYPATKNGTPGGESVLVNAAYMEQKRRDLGPYIFACQWLLNPVADDRQGFKREWIEYHDGIEMPAAHLNKYILVDPANEKKKGSDYTAMWVVGLGADNNYYILDIVRDRLNLTERWEHLLALHNTWKPLGVGYEKYGKDSDIQYFNEKQSELNYRFHITPLGGQTKKEDRIRRLVPIFEQGRFYFPEALWFVDYEGKQHDLVREFIDQEYLGFPVATHDDMLDCLARIRDPDFPTSWPREIRRSDGRPLDRYARAKKPDNRTWMSL